jgi:triosephosphate isomerase
VTLVLNLKTYPGTYGTELENLLDNLPHLDDLVVCPQHTDLGRVADTKHAAYAQHISPEEPGRNTGTNTAEAVAETGADGTLTNHSEHRLKDREVEKAIKRAEQAGLKTIVCAQKPTEVARYSALGTDAIALEIPELIAGEESISETEPQMLRESARRSDVPVLAGAGISTTEDVEKALQLGADGVLVASGVAKADNPAEKLSKLHAPMR